MSSTIPLFFYLAFPLTNRSLQSLEDHRFVGCKGVSTNPNIWALNPEYNILLTMLGQALMNLNKLSQIQYSNLDYLLADDLNALRRISNARRPIDLIYRAIIHEIDILPEKPDQILDVIDSTYTQFKKQGKTIQNASDFFQLVQEILSNLPLTEKARNRWMRMTLEKFISEILEKWFDQYRTNFESEQEWIIKDQTLTIPDRSLIYVIHNPAKLTKREFQDRVETLRQSGYKVVPKDKKSD